MVRLWVWDGGVCSPVVAIAVVCACLLGGCSDAVHGPSADELARFETAGSMGPSVDLGRIAQARITPGPYRTTTGDVLQIQMDMPGTTSQSQSLEERSVSSGRQSYTCRVSDDGMILLPVVGWMEAEGRSLGQIEAAIGSEYYPKYVKTPVPVYASVLEYRTRRVSIVGAVAKPGIYALRHEQMSLVALLMEAGGIVDKGAAVIRISRQDRGSAVQTRVRFSAWTEPENERGRKLRVPGAAGRASQQDALFAEPLHGETCVPTCAIFEPEGPLNTTGWLTLQDGRGVQSRTWLDIGNPFQRRSLHAGPLLEKADLGVQDDLGARLAQLATDLESDSREHRVSFRISGAGWEKTHTGQFVTSLPAPATSESRVAEMNPIQRVGIPGQETKGSTVILPVRGLNIPFSDVALDEGDSVVVEWPDEQFVSVVGLVNRPGNFPYPANTKYTLIQAIALAGGLDAVANPRCVNVYRLSADGTIANVTVQLVNPKDKEQLTEALALPLKPGDIVSVESTFRTRTNVFLDRIFRVSLGLYVTPDTFWR